MTVIYHHEGMRAEDGTCQFCAWNAVADPKDFTFAPTFVLPERIAEAGAPKRGWYHFLTHNDGSDHTFYCLNTEALDRSIMSL